MHMKQIHFSKYVEIETIMTMDNVYAHSWLSST